MIEIKDSSHPDINGISFCLRAMSKGSDDNRTHIKHAIIQGGYFVVTDGSRIHRYLTCKKYRSGLYRVFRISKYNIVLVRTKIPIRGNWPSYKSLFKAKKSHASLTVSFDKWNLHQGIVEVIRNIHPESGININYLIDLGDTFQMTVPKEKEDGIIFRMGRKSAAIMPMRV